MISNKNIVITGFMGTGKTTIGKEIAGVLKREFVDTDALIQSTTGLTINEIFEKHGESYFRMIEKKEIGKIADRNNIVIATGGGTLLNEENRARLMRSGIIFTLMADIDTLINRVSHSNKRPLINNGSVEIIITKLLKKRESLYGNLPNHIDTSVKSISETVTEVIKIFNQINETN